MQISLNTHSSIKINDIYIDPYQIPEESHDAKYVFITHSHYDHFSLEDIKKVINNETKIIIPLDCAEKLKGIFVKDNIFLVEPNNSYKIDELVFSTTYAYNIDKSFHLKDYNWVGYIFEIEGKKVYVAGDTDYISPLENVTCDIALVPIGGTFTMDVNEAATFINKIKPHKVIPIHYGTLVGNKEDAEIFASKLNNSIECEIILQKKEKELFI